VQPALLYLQAPHSQEDKTGPVWGSHQWEGWGYDGNIMYSCMKMEKMKPVEPVPEREEGG
jgi:hypothetical protein